KKLLGHLIGAAERLRFRRTTVMEYRKGSLGFGVRGLDDRRPAGNFALHQRGEWLLPSLCLAWNVAADIDQTPAHVVVVECPVERIGELVEDRLGHALRRKQGKPRQS